MESLVSLETAKKLKVARFPQATLFHHFGGEVLLTSEWDTGKHPELPSYVAAPTAQEVADQLPAVVITTGEGGVAVWPRTWSERQSVRGDTIAEALAALYLKLPETQQ